MIPALWKKPDVKEGLPAERLDNYVAALWSGSTATGDTR